MPGINWNNIIQEELAQESDRAAGIIGAAFLDDVLAGLITAFLVDAKDEVDSALRGEAAPLGTFAARIRMAYLLGLIGPNVKDDLTIIRRLRNDFAHVGTPINFDDQSIKARCQNFKAIAELDRHGPPVGERTARHLYLSAVILIGQYLEVKLDKAIKEKRQVASDLVTHITLQKEGWGLVTVDDTP